MLTYVPPTERPAISSPQKEKPWLLLLLCAFWLLPGLLGHDPWKPLENQSMAIIQQLLRGSDWALPSLTGSVHLEQAPLYYWGAASLGYLLSWVGISLHDAARLSTGIWVGLAMWGVGMAGFELHGRRFGRVAVVALIGSIGLLQWGHHVSPAGVAFAAFAWQLYALALARRRPLPAGGLLGLSWLVLMLGATWSEALLAMLAALVLLGLPDWRKSTYLAALVAAFAIAVPLGLLWPLSLYRKVPLIFDLWLRDQSLGLYGGITQLHFFHKLGYLPSIVSWFAFPVLPLAAWSLWLHRRTLIESRWQLLIVQTGLIALWLLLAGEPDEAQALLLLVPLAVLAAAGVDELKRSAASSLYWFGTLTFGALALALWGAWLALQLGWPARVVSSLHRHGPAFSPVIGLGVLFALGISAAWVHVLLGKRPFGRRAVTGWACGLTLVWGLLVSLWQPWLDYAKTYRTVGQYLAMVVTTEPGCVSIPIYSMEQRGGLAYFSGLELRGPRAKDAAQCPWLLSQTRTTDEHNELRWEGGRAGENNERFYLYRRK